jgi:hypothetical protein
MSLTRLYGDRIMSAVVLAWWSRHQSQIIDPANQLPAIVILLFAILVTAHFESRLQLLSNADYRPMRIFLESLFALTGVLLSWGLVSVILEFYGESLGPFLSVENAYRTLSFVLIVSGVVALSTYLLETIAPSPSGTFKNE